MKRIPWACFIVASALALATLPAFSQQLADKEIDVHAKYLIERSEAVQDIAQGRAELWALQARGADQEQIDRKAEAVQASITKLQELDGRNVSQTTAWRGCQGLGLGLGRGLGYGACPYGVGGQGQARTGQGLGPCGYGLGRGHGYGTGTCPYGGWGPRWGRGGGGGYGASRGMGYGPRWAR